MNRKWFVAILLLCVTIEIGYAQRISDPEGTVQLRLSDRINGETSFYPGDITSDAITLTSGHNFSSVKGLWEFANVGRRDGLGYIQKIPENGWVKTVGVAPGNGYVARIRKGYGDFGAVYEYAGIYCDKWIVSTSDAIIGACIKYVSPFSPRILADTYRLFEYDETRYADYAGLLDKYPSVTDLELAKWYLKQADKNGDGIISRNEAQAVTRLGYMSYGNKPTTVEELNQFPNLEAFRMEEGTFQPMSSLELAHPKLKELWIDYVKVGSLNLSGCISLQKITIDHSELKQLVLPKSVVELNCAWNMLKKLDLSRCTNLKKIVIFENELTEIDVSKLTELEVLSCGYNNLSSLDVSKNKKLKRLYCASNDFEVLDISQNLDIEVLVCVSKTPEDKIKTIYIPANKTKRDYKTSSGTLTWFTGINVINK